MVLFDCGVAPMWPEPVREQCTEPTGHDDSQAPASAKRSRRPSTVLEMFWSTEPTWISVLVGATQSKRSSSARTATTAARSAKYPSD
jgi:hypothetical protein